MKELLPKDKEFSIAGFSFGGMVSGHIATLCSRTASSASRWSAPAASRPRASPARSCTSFWPRCRPRLLAAEARRNLEILMLHDPKNVDGIAIYMQILNTTRAKTRSRIMGQAFKLERGAAAGEDAAHRHLGRV